MQENLITWCRSHADIREARGHDGSPRGLYSAGNCLGARSRQFAGGRPARETQLASSDAHSRRKLIRMAATLPACGSSPKSAREPSAAARRGTQTFWALPSRGSGVA